MSIEDELMMYVNLLMLLYADDTVLMVESADVQCAFNEFSIYCTQWKLNVNVENLYFQKVRS